MASALPRAGEACPACAGKLAYAGPAVASPFFARRVLGGGPFLLDLQCCPACGTARFDAAPDAAALARLYAGYRGAAYQAERQSCEPWYTKKANAALGGTDELPRRALALADLLDECGIAPAASRILDHGGADGALVALLPAAVRKSYDISGVAPIAGVAAADPDDLVGGGFDLVLCCHVLEHVSDPLTHLQQTLRAVRPGGAIYLEVPDERFAMPVPCPGLLRRWLVWVLQYPGLTRWLDFFSTACRIKLGFIPPGGAPFLREHLVYFSVAGLARLAERAGLRILACRKLSTGHIGLLGVHSVST